MINEPFVFLMFEAASRSTTEIGLKVSAVFDQCDQKCFGKVTKMFQKHPSLIQSYLSKFCLEYFTKIKIIED
jgi:hypothetical protein